MCQKPDNTLDVENLTFNPARENGKGGGLKGSIQPKKESNNGPLSAKPDDDLLNKKYVLQQTQGFIKMNRSQPANSKKQTARPCKAERGKAW